MLGLLLLTSIPTVAGVSNALNAQKKKNETAKEKIKFNLAASLDGELCSCLLKDGKV